MDVYVCTCMCVKCACVCVIRCVGGRVMQVNRYLQNLLLQSQLGHIFTSSSLNMWTCDLKATAAAIQAEQIH